MKKILILGGGTFEPIRNHFSLSAPAFGTTARKLNELIPNSELILTKMADYNSNLITNNDVENYIDELLDDKNIGTIILNIAFCDFKSMPIDNIENGLKSERLKTSDGNLILELTPTDKVISKIRIKRPDIFLVGFKTTTNKSSDEQFLIALQMMKKTKCNLVLANDTVNKRNMIITPEESIYAETYDRNFALKELSDIILMRNNLTYNYSDFVDSESFDIKNTSETFQTVIKFLITNGGYIENNGNGFTPGHFCYKLDNTSFLSSQRKANHNLVFDEGLSKVIVNDDTFTVIGRRKASVGARSQWLMLEKYKDYDCIVHTHNPLKKDSKIPIAEQKPFQCGSIECGMNTLNNLQDFDGIKAVYLDKHGSNILFKSTENPDKIIKFIKDNIKLGIKVK
jgi:hypothetical protein